MQHTYSIVYKYDYISSQTNSKRVRTRQRRCSAACPAASGCRKNSCCGKVRARSFWRSSSPEHSRALNSWYEDTPFNETLIGRASEERALLVLALIVDSGRGSRAGEPVTLGFRCWRSVSASNALAGIVRASRGHTCPRTDSGTPRGPSRPPPTTKARSCGGRCCCEFSERQLAISSVHRSSSCESSTFPSITPEPLSSGSSEWSSTNTNTCNFYCNAD